MINLQHEEGGRVSLGLNVGKHRGCAFLCLLGGNWATWFGVDWWRDYRRQWRDGQRRFPFRVSIKLFGYSLINR